MRGFMQRYIEVRLRHVDLRRAGRTVLKEIAWTISPGEHWILAGENGAGKTQLLKLVAGSVWPSPTGREMRHYRIRGTTRSTPFEVQEEIAYVGSERQDRYERYGWNHTVEQIVGTGLQRTDIPLERLTARDRRRIAGVLARLAIAHLAARRFLTLSYGERRLALLARALAGRPKLLLLDELLTGLDGVNHAAALAWLNRTRGARLPWVLATHRLEELPASATHALVLRRGRIAYRGALSRAPLERWLGAPRTLEPEAGEPRLGGTPRRTATTPLVRLARAAVFIGERAVLEDISLEIRRGECWVVHGPNGAGKSTLLRTLYGDHAVAAGGRIERAGIEPGVPLEVFKRAVGLVAPHLHPVAALAFRTAPVLHARGTRQALCRHEPPNLTVEELVVSGRHASIGLVVRATAADRRAAQRELARFGVAALAQRPVRELSYGELRRVLFARAWVNRPALLLLDEPLAGVDAPTRHALLEELARVARDGTAIVLATHNRREWPHGVTHELELLRGRARYCGPVRLARARAP
ncbi:MAG TPA: ATP-binding cassette domain-containing protein [Steroidobacteraceae bacterium]|nr:ATP-binding cassette domain-containing protein [Steroidobacteraceae bacterium]